MSNAVSKIDNRDMIDTAPRVEAPVNLFAVIARAAADPTVDIEKFERLLAMQDRVEAGQAKKAFNAAVSAAKGAIGPILKDKAVDFTSSKGRTNYRYEGFDTVARQVDPVLNEHGLSYRFRSSQEGQRLRVTCVLAHRDGYSEETSLEASEDHSGNKNSIQAIGSAATYLQRYTLKLALGLSTSLDDDARATSGGNDVISDTQLQSLRQELHDTKANEAKFLAGFKIETLADLPAREFDNAMAVLADRRARQQAQQKEASK